MKSSLLIGYLLICSPVFAQTPQQDLTEFAEGTIFKTNIYEIEKLGLKKVLLPDDVKPWSGSYWADRAGSIAVRYTNSNSVEGGRIILGTMNSKREFKNDMKKLQADLYKMSEEDLGKLSPAEKYDLLVGDQNFTFTKNLWKKIEENKEHWGSVTLWTGICHGWAPASIHLPRPKKMLRLPILQGTRMLDVYPDDIKALGSFLWANKANEETQMFAGNRCNQKAPKIDSKTGVVIPLEKYSRSANECADVDPVVMHHVTVNRIGVMKRSFVVEVDYNAPVNNHPLEGYDMTFFNVNTNKDEALTSALVPKSMVKDDKLKNLRHPETTHVVGVELKLILTHWMSPEHKKTNSVADDKSLEETVVYELELDSRGEPVKGHWRIGRKGKGNGKPRFPDFIWNEYYGFRPSEYFTYVSRGLTVDLVSGITNEWMPAVEKNSTSQIILNNQTRLSHRLAKKEGIQSEAQVIMDRESISKAEAANRLADQMTRAGVPEKGENPMVISKVVLQLFELAK